MYCPACHHRLEAGVERCDLCNFHIGVVDARYGGVEVAMDQITDSTHFLRTRDRDHILEQVDEFEQQFPQLFPAFYIAELPPGTKLPEFATWLLNRARITVLDEMRSSENVYLFVIDLSSRSMTMTSGYFSEQFVSENDILELLQDASPYIAAGDLREGLQHLIEGLRLVLKRNYRILLKSMKPGGPLASANMSPTAVLLPKNSPATPPEPHG